MSSIQPLIQQYHALQDPAVKYNFIEAKFVGWQSPPIPMSFRILQQIQLSDQTRVKDPTLGDDRSRHIRAFMAGTIGAGFTAVARIIRITTKTIFLIPAVIVRSTTASRYGVDGAMKEFFTRYQEEWFDLGVTIATIPLGFIKAWKPSACSAQIDKITDIYLNRADRIAAFDQKWVDCQAKYQEKQKAAALVRQRTQEVSVSATA